jgi:voltage-gated potassium channel
MKRVWNETLTILAVAFLISFSYPAFVDSVSTSTQRVLDLVQLISWVAFALDLIYGVYKSENWKSYLRKHPLDVLAVTLPFLRPLRVLRVISFGALALEKVALARSMAVTTKVIVTTIFLTYIAAVQMTIFERDADGSNIKNFGDGIWWAFVSVTTVGYGDKYPVTTSGKFLAVALLVLGISLLATITASVATSFIQFTQGHAGEKPRD